MRRAGLNLWHWTGSLAVHGLGLILAGTLARVAPLPVAPEPEPFLWDVMLVPAALPQVPPPRDMARAPASTRQPVLARIPPLPVAVPAGEVRPRDMPPPAPMPMPVSMPVPARVPAPSVAPVAGTPAPLAMPETAVLAAPPAAAGSASELVPTRAQADPAPAGAAEREMERAAAAERRWYAALVDQLRALKRYPLPARRLGQEGVVLLRVRVAPDGGVEAAEILRSSGHGLLDREALRLFQAAAGAARAQLRPERLARLEIPIAYRLGE